MASEAAPELGELPRWNLDDLYPGIASAELEAAFVKLADDCAAFETRYKGKLASLDGAVLGQAIAEYEACEEVMGRIGSFAGLTFVTHMGDADIARFYQGVQERLTDISTHLLFFALEINRLDDAALKTNMADPALAHYAPWVETVRLYRDHQLSDESEQLLHDKSVTGRAAWNRLFDETIAGLRFDVDGEVLTEEQCLALLSDPDGDTRKKAALALGEVFKQNVPLFSLITNTLAKDKEVEDRWRKYDSPAASRHLDNQIEPEVAEALVSAVQGSYADLSHRYYKLKASWFGKDALPYWDRNAPLPDEDDTKRTWSDAQNTVIEAYHAFAPDMAEIGQRFFDRGWIDAEVRPGKQGGAFSASTVPSVHPYILTNYQGRTRDIMTLAHELGHGVHQVLAAPQGSLMSSTPLTLAETASVFGEMLTFRALLAQETDPKKRKFMIAGKVEDMINTVVRQVAFHSFETRVHDERRSGELTPDRLAEIWMDVQRESLGPGIELTPDYENFWVYIPHFIHSPFYVYAYAFGDCLVNSLYAVYQDSPDGFVEKYFDLLRAGGTKRHKELLAPFGLDASDPDFWKRGLSMISGFIDELEKE
jgi:oligoendopeptidase F